MPAHITHNIFGEDVIEQSQDKEFSKTILTEFSCFFHIGCQGPDIFYHNRRLKPSGLKFGSLLHHGNYGKFTRQFLSETIKEFNPKQAKITLERFAFIIGFATHAILDRHTHPFINYFSGWVEASKPETKKYFRCHAFLERVLDVEILRIKRGNGILDYDFYPTFYCGDNFPLSLEKPFESSLKYIFPSESDERTIERIRNAYRDSLYFYRITNPGNPKLIAQIGEIDIENEKKSRRLALVHPIRVPKEIDFLNLKHGKWCYPCDCSLERTESFLDLYDKALKNAIPLVKKIGQLLSKTTERGTANINMKIDTGFIPDGPVTDDPVLDEIEKLQGNGNLDTDRQDLSPCTPKYSSPLPLAQILDEMYSELYESSKKTTV